MMAGPQTAPHLHPVMKGAWDEGIDSGYVKQLCSVVTALFFFFFFFLLFFSLFFGSRVCIDHIETDFVFHIFDFFSLKRLKMAHISGKRIKRYYRTSHLQMNSLFPCSFFAAPVVVANV